MINMGWDSAGSLLAMMAAHVHDDYNGLELCMLLLAMMAAHLRYV